MIIIFVDLGFCKILELVLDFERDLLRQVTIAVMLGN